MLRPQFLLLLMTTIHNTKLQNSDSNKNSTNLYDEYWKWICDNNRCTKRSVETLHGLQEHIVYNSLRICRLLCATSGALWPKPTGTIVLSQKLSPFDPMQVNANVTCSPGHREELFLNDATTLFSHTLAKECGIRPLHGNRKNSSLFTVEFCVSHASTTLLSNTDESYDLTIDGNEERQTRAMVKANTVFGARHALETLSQLTACGDPDDEGGPMVIVAGAHITDKPEYQHRGLLVDTGRNWLPERAIYRTIDAMAANKMNVLHWHATDSDSFPLLLPRVPQMAKYGAYASTMVYTADSIRRISDYANLRGVRILIEIDAPGHSAAGWIWRRDENSENLALCVTQKWKEFCYQPPCGILNPKNPNVFKVFQDVYHDLLTVLPYNDQIHLGGDELLHTCWNVSLYSGTMSENDFLLEWAQFHLHQQRVFDVAFKYIYKNKENTFTNNEEGSTFVLPRAILWSSHLTENIENFLDSRSFIVEVWEDTFAEKKYKLLMNNFDIIVIHTDVWYLDHGFGPTKYYTPWQKSYNAAIPMSDGTGRVLGGEAALWGEIADESVLDGRIWPRAAAIAERLWSDFPMSSDTTSRLVEQRERLVRRGVASALVTPEWCVQNENQCH